jgi:hypothetical protein
MSGKSGKHPSVAHQPGNSRGARHSMLRAIVGVAIAALVAGPFLMIYSMAIGFLFDDSISVRPSALLPGLALISLYALPAAIVNGVALDMLARQGKDSLALALCSGAVLGVAVEAASLVIEGPPIVYDAPEWLTWLLVMKMLAQLVLTGLSMSIPQWWIAIRPSRQFRLGHARDEEAIRAMS